MNATEPKTEAEKALDDKAAQIAKLLAKAESTTPEEAQALNEHAQRLMAKYAIDQARIDANRALGKKESIIQAVVEFRGSWAATDYELMIGIAHNMAVKPLVGSLSNGKYVRLIGFESDVNQAQALMASLQIQAALALRSAIQSPTFYAWDQTTAVQKYQARRDFMFGFGHGALSQMRRVRAQVLAEEKAAEATAAIGEPGTELVLVKKDERIAQYMTENFGRLGRGRATQVKRGYGSGYSGGVEAGKKANVNGRTEIGGTRRKIT